MFVKNFGNNVELTNTKSVSLGNELKIYETIIIFDTDSKEIKDGFIYTFMLSVYIL